MSGIDGRSPEEGKCGDEGEEIPKLHTAPEGG